MVGEIGPDGVRLTPVARFPNAAVPRADGLHWDIAALRDQVVAGLRAATGLVGAEGLVSVGIDSWAVDYGLMRDGDLLGEPFHYRDERRCAEGPRAVHERLDHAELFSRNGLQFLPFTTLYQLAADPLAREADRFLLIPDLLGYWLTGRAVAERTNASTTGLLGATSGLWDDDVVSRIGLPRRIFPEIVDAGDRVGTISGEMAAGAGVVGIPLVSVGSHDTASAVVGVPLEGEDAAYISLGTWGLVGVELAHPVLSDDARGANFTNERGVDGTIRFLTNVMGTWLLSESLRAWGTDDLTGLLAAAAEIPSGAATFDVQDARFLPPGDLPSRITQWYADRHLPPPTGRPALVRAIVESLAEAYARVVDDAERLSEKTIRVVHVVGGGARNRLLCQAIADHSGRRVVAGPVEATALGNVLVQARTAGLTGTTLSDLRDLVRRSVVLQSFLPGERARRVTTP